jgi:hypothetical protein
MGAAASKLSDVATMFQAYATASVDGLLAVRLSIGRLVTSHHLEGVLDADDLDKYRDLDAAKLRFVAEVQTFIETLAIKLRAVHGRVSDSETYSTLQACYEGFSKDTTLQRVTELQARCLKLQHDFANFKKDFDHKYGPESAKVKRVAGAVVCSLVAIGAVATIVLHFIPVVNFTLAPAVLGSDIVSAGLVGVLGVALGMSRSEVERAQDFLKDMETKLRDVRNHITTVRANAEALSVSDRREVSCLLGTMIKECDIIVQCCRSL